MLQTRLSFPITFFIGCVILLMMFALSLMLGAAQVPMRDVWLALMTNEAGDSLTMIREIRLPRGVAAIFLGAALSVAGAVMQGMTRNPLADPGLLGLTAGANAALAVTIALITTNYVGIMIACFIGAAVGAGLVFSIGRVKRGGMSPFRLVLAGAAVSAFLHAIAEGIGLSFKISREVSLWTSGGLLGASWAQLQIVIPVILFGLLIAILLSRQVTILSLNDDVATGLGQKTELIKALLFIVIILLAGASVALAGNLAFVGLMVPHIVRSFVGTDYRFIIPMSAIIGATFMLMADTLARTISAPYEAPVAAILAIIGLPFFLWVVRKGGKGF
ncbi:iron ABC transporter permease [Salipaludibacillus agaradhaerens]|uniref:Iron ABC transporter permease n=2 Tax=Salipaludibacillus agaradhaerens TaxID=76935 RepID=A0A9Q4B5J5_SALAG|nr:iron ABC transporter permease [Salipaludibacillus agaradhaerens]MCR6098707.1 iron ABC transporter permease [Salipaludibacillus agaradhaerens]MCR6108376.1 iron ABC transporter permease [Salipaludibacillus agaradhaerens]MCR6115714.1 iron ABC transporter permease [Salipaludibacillus agaradhaerens]MCR6120399.1 iron ABC transporter permease [Salipaludibacillus agaradhaerens]